METFNIITAQMLLLSKKVLVIQRTKASPTKTYSRKSMLGGNCRTPHTSERQRLMPGDFGGFVIILLLALLVSGCATPNLKPFADASSTLSISVKRGGDLAIKPLAKTPIWVNNDLVPPGDSKHPYKKLEDSWELRQKAMDAVLIYSTSLDAINEAAAHREENAEALVNSVQQLASAVPGYGAAFNSFGTLVVKGLKITVEVKAYHDMRQAVEAADPAIQLVARRLIEDFTELSNLFVAPLNEQLSNSENSVRPLKRYVKELEKRRDALRKEVEGAPGNSGKGIELARFEALYAPAAAELKQILSDRGKVEDNIAQGKEFFANVKLAVDAWAAAHAELVKAFKDQRMPSFALLAARAEELKETVSQLKRK